MQRVYKSNQNRNRVEFLKPTPGRPLGNQYPDNKIEDTKNTHRNRWKAIVRRDPCIWCGKLNAGTIEHIEPKALREKPGSSGWINYGSACSKCNQNRGTAPMLKHMLKLALQFDALKAMEENNND